jgi:hypothetical protein
MRFSLFGPQRALGRNDKSSGYAGTEVRSIPQIDSWPPCPRGGDRERPAVLGQRLHRRDHRARVIASDSGSQAREGTTRVRTPHKDDAAPPNPSGGR